MVGISELLLIPTEIQNLQYSRTSGYMKFSKGSVPMHLLQTLEILSRSTLEKFQESDLH